MKMAASKTGFIKTTIITCAFLCLLCWVALLQSRYEDVRKKFDTFVEQRDSSFNPRAKRSNGQSPDSRQPQSGGATYIRWGRTVCPADAEVVYKGTGGGEYYQHEGGSSEYICLPEDPEYATTTRAAEEHAFIRGVEMESDTGFSRANSGDSSLINSDIHCVVCRTSRSTAIMIPAKKSCKDGWQLEYWGYLMTGHYKHKASYNYACVDNAPDAGKDSGDRDESAAMMYNVQGNCGSLPCPPYSESYELTCVVCSK